MFLWFLSVFLGFFFVRRRRITYTELTFILTRISRIDTKPCGRYSYYSKPWTATNFTNHPDGISAIRSTEGALCNQCSLHSFVKICVIRVKMNKLNTSET